MLGDDGGASAGCLDVVVAVALCGSQGGIAEAARVAKGGG